MGKLYTKEERAKMIESCYQSFAKTGYTCGGCINYSQCRMAHKDTEAMVRFIKAMEGS